MRAARPLLSLALAASLACAGAAPSHAGRAVPGPASLQLSGTPLLSRFDEDAGKPRLLMLASPT